MILNFFKTLIKPIWQVFNLAILNFSLKKKYPTIKLLGKNSIQNSIFGNYNSILDARITNSKLGSYSYISSNSDINFCEIGKFSCIGPNVKIGLGSHPTSEFISIHPAFYSTAAQVGTTFSDQNYFQEYDKTFIGNDVWIGANVIVKSGVVIGDGAIIASGSVVTKNVLPYSIMGGVPSRCIKMRFEKEEIDILLDFKWWDRDEYWLRKNFMYFHSIKNLSDLKDL